MTDVDVIALHNGDVLQTHGPTSCVGNFCCVHNPSKHPLRDMPLNWRADRGLMERICRHGIGHPDPDDLAFKRKTRGKSSAYYERVHGCDGYCRGENFLGDVVQ